MKDNTLERILHFEFWLAEYQRQSAIQGGTLEQRVQILNTEASKQIRQIKYKQTFNILTTMYLIVEKKHGENLAQNGVQTFMQKEKAEVLHIYIYVLHMKMVVDIVGVRPRKTAQCPQKVTQGCQAEVKHFVGFVEVLTSSLFLFMLSLKQHELIIPR